MVIIFLGHKVEKYIKMKKYPLILKKAFNETLTELQFLLRILYICSILLGGKITLLFNFLYHNGWQAQTVWKPCPAEITVVWELLVILYLEEGENDSEWHACKKKQVDCSHNKMPPNDQSPWSHQRKTNLGFAKHILSFSIEDHSSALSHQSLPK